MQYSTYNWTYVNLSCLPCISSNNLLTKNEDTMCIIRKGDSLKDCFSKKYVIGREEEAIVNDYKCENCGATSTATQSEYLEIDELDGPLKGMKRSLVISMGDIAHSGSGLTHIFIKFILMEMKWILLHSFQ